MVSFGSRKAYLSPPSHTKDFIATLCKQVIVTFVCFFSLLYSAQMDTTISGIRILANYRKKQILIAVLKTVEKIKTLVSLDDFISKNRVSYPQSVCNIISVLWGNECNSLKIGQGNHQSNLPFAQLIRKSSLNTLCTLW